MKNYLSLILNGYLHNSDYLTEYFYREQKNAEKEFIEANEFFDKCFDIIEAFKEDLDKPMYRRKNELYQMLSIGKQKKDNELIKNCETELKEISRDNYSVTLYYFTNGQFTGHLWHKQILFIEQNLKLAKIKELEEVLLKKVGEKEKQKNTGQPRQLETKEIFDFIHNIKDKKEFIKDLKNTFKTEKGKSIRAIINILEVEKILIFGAREFKALYNELNKCFGRNIGTYQSIQNEKNIDSAINDPIDKKLNPLIIKYKNN